MPVPARGVSPIVLDQALIHHITLICKLQIINSSAIRDVFLMDFIDLFEHFGTDSLVQFGANVEAWLADFKSSLTRSDGQAMARGHQLVRLGLIMDQGHVFTHGERVAVS